MKKVKLLVPLAIVLIVLVTACGPKQVDYDKVTAQVTKLTGENATLASEKAQQASRITELEGQLEILRGVDGQLKRAEDLLNSYAEILCEQPWDEPWNKAQMFFPLDGVEAVDPGLQFVASVTQWSHDPKWEFDNTKDFSVLYFDREGDPSMILDARHNCVIVNPDVYPFFGN